MNKSALMWANTKAWCIANPDKVAAIAMIDGQFEIKWTPRKPLAGADPVFYDERPSIDAIMPGLMLPEPRRYDSRDCISCDNYILNEAETPYCPTCARLIREGKPLA